MSQTCCFCGGPNSRSSTYCTDICHDDDMEFRRLRTKREKKREHGAMIWLRLAGVKK